MKLTFAPTLQILFLERSKCRRCGSLCAPPGVRHLQSPAMDALDRSFASRQSCIWTRECWAPSSDKGAHYASEARTKFWMSGNLLTRDFIPLIPMRLRPKSKS